MKPLRFHTEAFLLTVFEVDQGINEHGRFWLYSHMRLKSFKHTSAHTGCFTADHQISTTGSFVRPIYNYGLPLFLAHTIRDSRHLKATTAQSSATRTKHTNTPASSAAHLQSLTNNGVGLSVSRPAGEIALHQAPRSSARWQLLMELL